MRRFRLSRTRQTMMDKHVELEEYQINDFAGIQKDLMAGLGLVQCVDFIVEPLALIPGAAQNASDDIGVVIVGLS